MISFLLKPRFHVLLTVRQNSAGEIGDPRILITFLKCEDYDFRFYPLTSPVSENDTDLFLANEESYSPQPVRTLCHHKHNLNSA